MLADHIAILGAPGKLLAQGSPVALKRDLGEGYTIQVSLEHKFKLLSDEKVDSDLEHDQGQLLDLIRSYAPETYSSVISPHQVAYHLKSKDTTTVESVLEVLDQNKEKYHIGSYDILGTSIEDIFLQLMSENEIALSDEEKETESTSSTQQHRPDLQLSSGRYVHPLKQATTIFYKRWLIARRAWLTLALAVIVAVAGSTIPLVFIRGLEASCVQRFTPSTNIPLYLPNSPIGPLSISFDSASRVLNSPPGIISSLGNSTQFFRTTNISDNATFVQTIQQNFMNLSLGGISIDESSGNTLVAWEATPPGLTGPAMLNLASNVLYNHALNTSGNGAKFPTIIQANYESFPPVAAGTLFALKWVAFFGAAMVRSLCARHVFSNLCLNSQCILPSSRSTFRKNEDRQCKRCSFRTGLQTHWDCISDTLLSISYFP